MICPYCRAPLGVDGRFCPACGKALVPTETQAQDSSPLQSALIGREIAGRFRILAKLGEGGMGAVYRGEQISLKRAVAVKVLRPELSQNQMLLRRFSAEAEAVAKLDHPSTVKVYDFGQDTDGSLFIAMEYIEGGSLRDAMRAGALPGPRALAIALQVSASLADAHAQRIVHRDLKPDNVMLQDKGRARDIVRVLDFGIAKLRDDSRATQQAMTQAGDMLGTPQYMAPEQIRGDAIDGRTDVYALGCLIYEMVTGRLPFEGSSVMAILTKHLTDTPMPPSQRRPDLGLPPVIDQLALAGMAKEPASRPPTMERYGEMIANALAVIDPNRSGVLTPQPTPGLPFPAAHTPIPPSQPPMQPLGLTPIPPTVRSNPRPPRMPPAYAPPRQRNLVPLFAALALLGVGGGGVGIYLATRKAPAGGDTTLAMPADQPAQDPWVKKADPWAKDADPSSQSPSTPPGATLPTPIPGGTLLNLPAGFARLSASPSGLTYNDPKRSMFVMLAPLIGGTNDPAQLSATWVNQGRAFDVRAINQSEMKAFGKMRTVLWFSANVQGTKVAQMIILYIEPKYRFGLLVQFPQASASQIGDVLTPLLMGGLVLP